MDFRWLGRVDYNEGLVLQNTLVSERQEGLIGDTTLLLEHDPVYTIGRTRDRSSLRETKSLPHPVVETNRGGQATYHGPGQLVGYLILDLNSYGRDLHTYLRQIESFLIDFANSLGIESTRREGLTGTWVENRKLASIGVGVRKWISMHGFGLNVTDDLSGYQAITPCGISEVQMTSLSIESGKPVTVEQSAEMIQPFIRKGIRELYQA